MHELVQLSCSVFEIQAAFHTWSRTRLYLDCPGLRGCSPTRCSPCRDVGSGALAGMLWGSPERAEPASSPGSQPPSSCQHWALFLSLGVIVPGRHL